VRDKERGQRAREEEAKRGRKWKEMRSQEKIKELISVNRGKRGESETGRTEEQQARDKEQRQVKRSQR